MNIAKQHQEFKIRANKIDSNHYQDLKPNQIDSFLDGAALFMLNHYGELFEFNKTQFNKDLFGTLLVTHPDQPNLTLFKKDGQLYEYVLNNLKYNYLHLDRAYVQCEHLVIPVSMIVGDEQQKLNDAYTKPSFKWKRLLGKIAKSSEGEKTSLYIYSDVDLQGKNVRLDYVKYPKKVFFGYYDSLEFLDCKKRETNLSWSTEDCNKYYKKTDSPVNSDLPESYHDLQVDVAVFLATGKTENQFLNQFISNKITLLPK
jgi:hypothetical protein